MEKDYQFLSTFGCTENGGSRNSGAQSTVDERAPLRCIWVVRRFCNIQYATVGINYYRSLVNKCFKFFSFWQEWFVKISTKLRKLGKLNKTRQCKVCQLSAKVWTPIITLVPDVSEIQSPHADCAQLRMTWIPVQLHRSYRASQRSRKSRACPIMCVYRKHGGQRGL